MKYSDGFTRTRDARCTKRWRFSRWVPNTEHNHPPIGDRPLSRQKVANACKKKVKEDEFDRPAKIRRKTTTIHCCYCKSMLKHRYESLYLHYQRKRNFDHWVWRRWQSCQSVSITSSSERNLRHNFSLLMTKWVWPGARVIGCRFHLGQAWNRRIQRLGLSKMYRNQLAEGSYTCDRSSDCRSYRHTKYT